MIEIMDCVSGYLVFSIFIFWTSLITNIAHQLLKERSLLLMRPVCRSCDARLSWYDVVPVISYIFFRGKCRLCASPKSFLYLALDVFGAVVFTACFYYEHGVLEYAPVIFLLKILFISALIMAIRTDLEEMVILRVSTIYLIPVWFFFSLMNCLEINFYTSFFGALLGYFIPWFAGKLYRFVRGVDGIGVGDFELLAMIGAFVGPARMLDSMIWGCAGALVFGVVYALLFARGRGVRIPFAPFLSLGALFELFR
ncbi:prepilin peptidase [Candidatus Dependentiae bacterium]|nr:prepilin peptidase [Candidatus Dependentiae bacterium]